MICTKRESNECSFSSINVGDVFVMRAYTPYPGIAGCAKRGEGVYMKTLSTCEGGKNAVNLETGHTYAIIPDQIVRKVKYVFEYEE